MEGINVTISIDDLHPEQEGGGDGDKAVAYLKSLQEGFGCKFKLFIPSNESKGSTLPEHTDEVEFVQNHK